MLYLNSINPPSFFKIRTLLIVSVFLCINVLSGCASTQQTQQQQEYHSDPRDPFESINRPLWDFNWQYLDKYALKPASEFYVEYTPTFVRKGLYNVALNLNEPSTIINNILQLKFKDAAKSTGRFVLNSTLGLLGLFDPATEIGIERQHESFNEVLGVWGVGNGPFLMIPAMGPSDVRSQVGGVVDRYYWPLAVIDFWPNVARFMVLGLEGRAALAQQEQLINDSFDSYEFIKNAYFQNVEFNVYDGNPPKAEVDDSAIDDYLDQID